MQFFNPTGWLVERKLLILGSTEGVPGHLIQSMVHLAKNNQLETVRFPALWMDETGALIFQEDTGEMGLMIAPGQWETVCPNEN